MTAQAKHSLSILARPTMTDFVHKLGRQCRFQVEDCTSGVVLCDRGGSAKRGDGSFEESNTFNAVRIVASGLAFCTMLVVCIPTVARSVQRKQQTV